MRSVMVRLGIVTILLVSLPLAWGVSFDGLFDRPFLRALGADSCYAGNLCVHFLDVGQGDATFIESPTGVQVLIDGGPGSGVLRMLGEHMDFFDRSLDVVIATHPDGDHIGGLMDVFKRFTVATIMQTDNTNDTPAFHTFSTLVNREGATVFYARAGQTIRLGGGATLDILFPDRSTRGFESNTSSIVARLVYGENELLLMGDAPKAIEAYVVDMYGADLKSDVLKVGHHGSDTSTAETFVSAVDPEYAVISAGRDNHYGHPHPDVLETLKTHGIKIQNTATMGSITFVSNGETLKLK